MTTLAGLRDPELGARVQHSVEGLTPGYFALVMASGMVNATRGLIAGVSVVFWAFATWLIPVLVVAGWWRHIVRKVPLRYEATLWSIIFPLGMYAVAGIYLGRADHLPIVEGVGQVELWVALAAWLTVFVAMAAHVTRTVFLSRV